MENIADSAALNTLVYGSLIFCETCNSLLDIPGDQDIIVCNVCGDTKPGTHFENIETITVTKPSAFPSVLKNKRSLITGISEDQVEKATIEELCAKCGNNQMTFYTMQLRSADEGQTVFYQCTKCGYQYRVNN